MAGLNPVSQVRAGAAIAVSLLSSEISLAIRASLEAVFFVWRKEVAPVHFTREAFSKYPGEYHKNYKREFDGSNPLPVGHDKAAETARKRSLRTLFYEVRRWKNSPRPLVKTGRTRAEILRGSVIFNKNSTKFSATWPNVPSYFYMRVKGGAKNWKGGETINKPDALLARNAGDDIILQKAFEAALDKLLKDPSQAKKLGGVIAVEKKR